MRQTGFRIERHGNKFKGDKRLISDNNPFARRAARTRRYFDDAKSEIAAANLTQLRLCSLFGILLTPLFFAFRPLLGGYSFSAVFFAPLAVFAVFFALSLSGVGKKSSAAAQRLCALFCSLTSASLIACGAADESGCAAILAPLFIVALPSLFIFPPPYPAIMLLAAACAGAAVYIVIKSPASLFGISAALSSVAIALPLLYMISKQRVRDYYARMKFRRMSMMDRMTGVLNKAAFEQRAQEYLAGRAQGELCALFLFDLDHFKDVNDTLGHAVGDELIECVGESLAGCFRGYDIVGRVGGDEFAALMECVGDIAVISRKAAELQRAIQAESFERVGREVSCSIGVAYTAEPIDYDALFKSADSSLYRAKNAGRGRAVAKYAGAPQQQAQPRGETR